jgi:hypothetical protein
MGKGSRSFFRDGNDEIYVMGADGSNAHRLTDNEAMMVSHLVAGSE